KAEGRFATLRPGHALRQIRRTPQSGPRQASRPDRAQAQCRSRELDQPRPDSVKRGIAKGFEELGCSAPLCTRSQERVTGRIIDGWPRRRKSADNFSGVLDQGGQTLRLLA